VKIILNLIKMHGTTIKIMFFLLRCGPKRAIPSLFLRALDRTQRRNTVGTTSLEYLSAGRRELYLTTHNTHTHPGEIRTLNPGRRATADLRLSRAAAGIGNRILYPMEYLLLQY
jgi:hypothetical protein